MEGFEIYSYIIYYGYILLVSIHVVQQPQQQQQQLEQIRDEKFDPMDQIASRKMNSQRYIFQSIRDNK